jgi:hypothetical protein
MAESDYLSERAEIQKQLDAARPVSEQEDSLESLVALLENVRAAWHAASQEERNHLARTLFEAIRVEGKQIVGFKPRAAFAPFFQLNQDWWANAKHPDEPAGVSAQGTRSGSDGLCLRTVEMPQVFALKFRTCDRIRHSVISLLRQYAVMPLSLTKF